MYNIVIYLYSLGVAIASLFNEKVRKMWCGEREAVRTLKEKVDPQAQYVWFHAASLGEFEQGRPLMERLRRDHPEYKILLTFFSPSGYEVRKNYEGADIVCYLPLDTIGNARRFLRAVRPVMAFFIKYEFWYNYLHILKHRGVPVYSVSSIFRPNQVFFRWYGRQYSRVLKCFTRFFVQNEQSRELLATLGIHEVDVVGDTRFDRVLQIREAPLSSPVGDTIAAFLAPLSSPEGDTNVQDKGNEAPSGAVGGASASASPKIFVAGSSWPPDEEIFIRYFREKQLFGYGKWKMIIAPHVIDEEHLQLIEKQLDGFKVVRYTRYDCNAFEAADVLVVDCFGLLSSIYRFATVCYVGGGFGVGIHNVVEAAVWGKPVFFGPNNQRFMEAQELKNCGGGIEIGSYDDFARQMDEFAANPQAIASRGKIAAECVSRRSGATERIFSYLGL